MFLKDLPEKFEDKLEQGSKVYLIRKISNEVLVVYLEDFGTSVNPHAFVRWNNQHHYKLDLVKNEVLAVDATQRHRQNMRAWYTIWEPHREALSLMFFAEKKRKKKYGDQKK